MLTMVFSQVDTVLTWPQDKDKANSTKMSEEPEANRRIVVKARYSEETRKKAVNYLTNHSLAITFLHFIRRIPKSTLCTWRKNGASRKGKSGRKTLLRILEEELFLWFLKWRARKVYVSQSTISKKALKLAKSIMADPDIKLSEEEKKAYRDFGASNGWVDNFQTRYKITNRRITTKCTKALEEVKENLKVYFDDLNATIARLNPPQIFNMDEVNMSFFLKFYI